MRFSLDPGDVVGDGCWETVKRVFVMATPLWVGAFMALGSFYLSQAVDLMWNGAWSSLPDLAADAVKTILTAFLIAPVYSVFSLLGLVLFPILAFVMYVVFRAEKDTTWLWAGMCVVIGVLAMLQIFGFSAGAGMQFVAWIVFILLVLALFVGCWFYGSWLKNEQARHLMEVHMENEQRRAELKDKFGTKTFGQDNQFGLPDDDDA